MKEQLLTVLKKAKKGASFDTICEKLSIEKTEEKVELLNIIQDLIKEYEIYLSPNNNYFLMSKTSFKKGTFFSNRNGDGKVHVITSYEKDGKTYSYEEDFFVAKEKTNGAIDGDKVLVDTSNKDKNNKKCTIAAIIERSLDKIYGEVCRDGALYYVKSVDKKKNAISVILPGEAIEGQRVEVTLTGGGGTGFYVGEVTRVFDHKDDPDEDILWEAFQHGIDDSFSEESLEQLKYIPTSVREQDKVGCVDFSDWETFTIDGKDTKDMDDALSIKKLPNGNRLVGVHIARPSFYIPYNSPLDKDGRRKGNSYYLGGKVLPEYPHQISNGVCSLNEQVDRLTISCIMEVTPNGDVVSRKLVPGVINSDKKMNYDDVNKLLKTDEVVPGYEDFVDSLKTFNKLAHKLRNKRIKKGAIEFERFELKPIYDEEGRIIDFTVRIQDEAENLIEELMLLANESVDIIFEEKGLPCVHRVHDTPNEERLEDFLKFLEAIGIPFTDYSAAEIKSDPHALQALAKHILNRGKLTNLLSTRLIKCMARAKYSGNNTGHHGLAKDNYCHFTSPIRRYSDITVHRIIEDCIFNTKNLAKNIEKWKKRVFEIAPHVSKTERIADEAELAVLDMQCAEYMESHIGEEYNATIIDLSARGITVQLDNYVEGRIKIRDLPGEYIYNPETFTLISLSDKDSYFIGDVLKIKVKAASKKDRSIEFKVIEKLEENELKNVQELNHAAKIKAKEDRFKRGIK